MPAHLWLLTSYLIGSIPFGWILGRIAGRDIRQSGSGNIGATNLYRLCGARYGVPALLLDAAKGVVPVLCFAPPMAGWPATAAAAASPWPEVLCGLAAVLGHTFPIWFRFRGGKGVATGAGVLGALFPCPLLLALAVFAGLLAWKRYVSLGSVSAALALALAATALSPAPFGADAPRVGFAWLVAALVWGRHRGNLRRLWRGEEPPFKFRRARPAAAPAGSPADAPPASPAPSEAPGHPDPQG